MMKAEQISRGDQECGDRVGKIVHEEDREIFVRNLKKSKEFKVTEKLQNKSKINLTLEEDYIPDNRECYKVGGRKAFLVPKLENIKRSRGGLSLPGRPWHFVMLLVLGAFFQCNSIPVTRKLRGTGEPGDKALSFWRGTLSSRDPSAPMNQSLPTEVSLRLSDASSVIIPSMIGREVGDTSYYAMNREFNKVAIGTINSIDTNNDLGSMCDLACSTNLGKLYPPGWSCSTGAQLSRASVCLWRGVGCSLNGSITSLSLSKSSVQGTLPDSIGNLIALQRLSISINALSGMIPTSIGNLNLLTNLNLGTNMLSSLIPTAIGYLTSLAFLRLYMNKFSGVIPSIIGNLRLLSYLNLSYNKLSSSIPTTIGYLTSLTFLALRINMLSSTIPTTIGYLVSMKSLQLQTNKLSGVIPTSIVGNLKSLTFLNLGKNMLSSSIPTTIGYLTSLNSLQIHTNKVSGVTPSIIGNLKLLTLLNMANNKLSSSIPTTIGYLTAIKVLQFQTNKLTHVIPTSIGNLKLLSSLSLGNNKLSSSIPTTIGYLTSINILRFQTNKLTGVIPTSIERLQLLTELQFRRNLLFGSIPTAVSALKNLVFLDISFNLLSSSIPTTIVPLERSLTLLDLSNNKLTSSVPSEILQLTGLFQLSLENNRLTGRIPIEICYLRLGYISLSGNQLSCIPWCQDDNDWTESVSSVPRCQGDQDRALSDLQNSLGVVSALQQTSLQMSSKIIQSPHPFPTSSYNYTVNDLFAYQYVVEMSVFQLNGYLLFCTDPSCSPNSVIGKYGAPKYGDSPGWLLPPGAKTSLTIKHSTFYIFYQYDIRTCPFTKSGITITFACNSVFGFKLFLTSRFRKSVGWSFNHATPYHSSQSQPSALPYATGLCQPSNAWYGITCNKGEVTGISLSAIGLSGTLPSSIGLLTGLTSLDLSGNLITGTIPSSIGMLTKLDTLVLSQNRFKGSFPVGFLNMTNLYFVSLRNNELTGSIPTILVSATALQYLYLDGNSLSGEVPALLCKASTQQNTSVCLTHNTYLTCYQEQCSASLESGDIQVDPSMMMCVPTLSPSATPTSAPSSTPTNLPTSAPTPTLIPTSTPSTSPSITPSIPTPAPTSSPTSEPSVMPTPTFEPSSSPTSSPTSEPTHTRIPSSVPTTLPSVSPTTPTFSPSQTPSAEPSVIPTRVPTSSPTAKPTPTFHPTYSPTSTPTAVIVKPLLSPRETIALTVSLSAFGALVAIYVVYRQCFSPKALEKKAKWKRLRQLPVHRALLDSKPLPNSTLLDMIKTHKTTINEKDIDGNTVLGVILQKKSNQSVSVDLVYMLLVDCLPFDSVTGEPIDDSRRYGWTGSIQSDDDVVVSAVSNVLNNFRAKVELLANCTDITERRAIDIAGPKCKTLIFRRLYLHERFEVKEGPPEHCSATSMVLIAKDHFDRLNSHEKGETAKESKQVALKFMLNRDQYMKEVKLRTQGNFDEKYVIPLLMMFSNPNDDDQDDVLVSNVYEDEEFREDAALKGYGKYPYCIVMEAGSQSLKRLIDHERIVNHDWDAIKHLTKGLAGALQHMHENGTVHGDLKPLNVLLVGRDIKLIDLDASASIARQECVGTKYSSGYIPPEMLQYDEEGEAGVRQGDDLILAHPSQDIWALGCILYYLLSGISLFHVNTEDNFGSPEDYEVLCSWDPDVKERKLSVIHDNLGKNLLSLLLNKDPTKRPDAKHVLSHPFLTGQRVSRLQGDKADWDIFLSYRVASDSDHVASFYKSLTDKGFKVWWDKKCLLPGQNWEEGFCSGLMRCANFVCLLSRGAIRNPDSDRSNFEKLTVNSPCDNVLLEWRLALELKERGMIEGVFPIMIGNKDADGKYSPYFGSGCHPNAPDTPVESVERKLREHLDREGLGLPLKETETVKSIIGIIVANQGGFLEGDYTDAVADISSTIGEMVNLTTKHTLLHSPSKHELQRSPSKYTSTPSPPKIESAPAPRLAGVLKSAASKLSTDAARRADLKRQRLEQELSIRDRENAQLRQQLVEIEREKGREIEEFSQEVFEKTSKNEAQAKEITELRRLLQENGIVISPVTIGVFESGADGGSGGVEENASQLDTEDMCIDMAVTLDSNGTPFYL